jgi:hypothetical protein
MPHSPSTHFRLAARALAAGFVLLLLAGAATAATVQTVFTADNAYQAWLGSSTSVTTQLGGDENCSAADIFSTPETFSFNAGAGDYIYVVAYSDDADRQGVLGQFKNGGSTVYTGDGAWEVYATGMDIDPTCTTANSAPTAATLNAQIALANSKTGGTGSSRGWVGVGGGGTGTVGSLAIGEDNSTAGGTYPIVPAIDRQARWMWYDPPGAGDPFQSPTSGEFLIFRLRARSAIACLPPPRSLVSWWPLDETVIGTAADAAGPNPGTHTGGPTPVAAGLGGALHFDGVNDHIVVPDNSSLDFGASPGGDFSIALWVRTSDAVGVKTLLDKRENVGAPRGWAFFVSSGRLALQLAEGGSSFCDSVTAVGCTNYDSGVSIADGAVHFVAVTVNRDLPTGIQWYVDGNVVGTPGNPLMRGDSLANGAPLYIGHHAFNSTTFQGDLDEIELFNSALTEADLDAIYDAESSGVGKCKERIAPGWDYSYCLGKPSALAQPTVCNDSSQPQSYFLSFLGLPANSLPGCVAGPTQFTLPAGSQPLLVPPHSCRSVNVTVGPPPGATAGQQACFRVQATNVATGATLSGASSLYTHATCGRRYFDMPIDLPRNRDVTLNFQLENPTGSPVFLPLTFESMPSDMTSDEQIVSLNGGEPGGTVTRDVTIPARGTADVSVRARLTQPSPFDFQSVLLRTGNTVLASAEVRSATSSGCTPGPTALCLNNGRFLVQAAWKDFTGNSGVGQAVKLTGDTGYFWFFDPGNVEVVLKVLDGRGLNDNWWVFYGALSTVEYVITVTDTESGATRTYVNPSGTLASVADTSAIRDQPTVGSSAATADAAAGADWDPSDLALATALSTEKAGTCAPTSTSLCLQGNRFRVEATWRDFQGNTGTAQAVPLTNDTGYFWFFSSANIELMLKILNGTGLNHKWWVFYGALSSVEYHITVTDTVTGNVKTYNNPAGTLGSRADTDALPE